MSLMRRACLVAVVVGLAWSTSAPAQETVLRQSEIERSRLVDLLDPAPDSEAAGQPATRGATRSIRVRPVAPAASTLITFETDSARLGAGAQRALDEVAAALQHERLRGHRFLIEGHADPRGPEDYNQSLSERRAETVRRYLVERGGIVDARLDVIGKGEAEPLNRENIAAPENRRVRFVRLR
ncbi:MAG: OmpA family protein [Burkholderiales bacterium]|nr:MAG: OmpA family protein [Burkholderiales bacterium]